MKTTLIVIALVILAGCAAETQVSFRQDIVETSDSTRKPEWTHHTFRKVDNGFAFSGGVTDVADYALGVSEARAEAIKNGIISIQVKVGSEFSKFAEGSNMAPDMIGKWVSDGIAFLSDSLYVSGIRQQEIYYEKVCYNTEHKPHYNIWALCAISASDYRKAKIDAAQRLVNKYRKENNHKAKKKAEELLDRLRRDHTI